VFKNPKGTALVAGALAAAAGAGLLTAILLGQASRETEQQEEGLLLTANRDRLAICVDAIDVDRTHLTRAVERIEALLPLLAQHPAWRPGGLNAGEPAVDAACPDSPAVLKPGVEVQDRGPKGLGVNPGPGVITSSPSPGSSCSCSHRSVSRLSSHRGCRRRRRSTRC
jgi:hypothetical protein